jgi:hypothetical protein
MITTGRTTLIKHFFGWLEKADSQLSKSVPNVLVRQNGKNKIRINPNARYATIN